MLDIICEVHVIMARYTSNVDMFLEEYLIKVHGKNDWANCLMNNNIQQAFHTRVRLIHKVKFTEKPKCQNTYKQLLPTVATNKTDSHMGLAKCRASKHCLPEFYKGIRY